VVAGSEGVGRMRGARDHVPVHRHGHPLPVHPEMVHEGAHGESLGDAVRLSVDEELEGAVGHFGDRANPGRSYPSAPRAASIGAGKRPGFGTFPAVGGRGARPTRARIDLGAIRENRGVAVRRAGGLALIAVVKADAYGHGAVPVARALAAAGCRRLAVATVAEGALLREAGLALPLLVMGGVHDAAEAEAVCALHLVPALHHAEQVALLRGAVAAARRGAPQPVQVEVDTGMHRMGVPAEAAPDLLVRVTAEPGLTLDGTYTHLARADEPDPEPVREQAARFRRVLDAARERGVEPGLVHVSNSAGLAHGKLLADALPELGAVRPGLALYGASADGRPDPDLRPAMTFATRVVAVRAVRAGAGVGYSAEWRAPRDTQVATLPVGYADGVAVRSPRPRDVLVRGRRAPVVGRVSMDYTTIDVGGLHAAVGDEVVLFGEGAGERLPVEEVAARTGTIPYEVLTRVGARVPREYP